VATAPWPPFTNLSGSQESGTGESNSGHSRYMYRARVVNQRLTSQWPGILSAGATAPYHLLEALAPTSIVGAFSRGQLRDKRKGAGHQNQYLQNLSEPSIRLEPVNKSVHGGAKNPNHHGVE
jgi:hypothetical protein